MNQFDIIEATVHLRRGPGFNVKPEAERLDGKRLRLCVAWAMGGDDPAIYEGEWALLLSHEDSSEEDDLLWIASGDVTDVKLMERSVV